MPCEEVEFEDHGRYHAALEDSTWNETCNIAAESPSTSIDRVNNGAPAKVTKIFQPIVFAPAAKSRAVEVACSVGSEQAMERETPLAYHLFAGPNTRLWKSEAIGSTESWESLPPDPCNEHGADSQWRACCHNGETCGRNQMDVPDLSRVSYAWPTTFLTASEMHNPIPNLAASGQLHPLGTAKQDRGRNDSMPRLVGRPRRRQDASVAWKNLQNPDKQTPQSQPRKARLAALTREAVQALEERLPLPAAAAALGVSPAELRRACRRLGVPRWRHRAHAAAAAAVAAPTARAMAYAANLRRRYGKAAAGSAAGSASSETPTEIDSTGAASGEGESASQHAAAAAAAAGAAKTLAASPTRPS